MGKKDRKQRVGTGLCIGLLILFFAFIVVSMLYNSFLNRYGIEKLEDYFYSVSCSDYNYEFADLILKRDAVHPGCSTVRKGSIIGRNLDWLYSDACEFVVSTPADGERHKTLGVTLATPITEAKADRFAFDINYSLIPFYTVDGINDAGLFVCVNEVPSGDAGFTTGTNPGGERLCTAVVVRYLLDYASSVDEAISILREKDLYSNYQDGEPYEVHFMLSDSEKNVVAEIINNEVVIVDDCNIITNYYMALDEYTDHAEGIERYEILRDGYDGVTDEESMRELLKEVYYSRLYDPETDPVWYSEIYGDYFSDSGEEFTFYSDPSDFPGIMEKEREGYENKERSGEFWQTCHSSVYNLDARTLSVSAQENDAVYDFTLSFTSALNEQKHANNQMKKIMIPLNILCLMLFLVILFSMLFENPDPDRKCRCFTWMVLATAAALFSDIGAWIFDGIASRAFALSVFNYMAIVAAQFMAIAFIWYEYYYLKDREEIKKWPAVAITAFCTLMVIVLTVLTLMGKLFYIVDGVFFPTDLIIISTLASAINIILLLYTVFHSRRVLGLHDFIAFSMYGLVPLSVAVYELFNPTLEIGYIALSVAVFLMYVMLQSGQAEKLKMRKDILEELCYVDQLTGLNNRRAYDELLDTSTAPKANGVIFCDVNGLKYTNDHLGHKAGDELLLRFSEMLNKLFDSQSVFRISGDEFVVILPGIKEDEFRNSVDNLHDLALKNGDIAAVGGAFGASESVSQLVAEAEKYMYKSKAEFYARHPEHDRRKRMN